MKKTCETCRHNIEVQYISKWCSVNCTSIEDIKHICSSWKHIIGQAHCKDCGLYHDGKCHKRSPFKSCHGFPCVSGESFCDELEPDNA
jgi:hypothetical protein